MELKKIVWKRNNNGGESAYVGTIKVGNYYYNGVDSKNGKYKATSFLPQSGMINVYVPNSELAKELLEADFNVFIKAMTE